MRTVVRDPLTMAIEASLRDLQRDESKMEQEEGGEEHGEGDKQGKHGAGEW